MDKYGRSIDITKYVSSHGEMIDDDDRDRNYTLELGNVLIDAYHRNNRVLSTHLVAFTLYELISCMNPQADIYGLLRQHSYSKPLPVSTVLFYLERVMTHLKHMAAEGKIIYNTQLREKKAKAGFEKKTHNF